MRKLYTMKNLVKGLMLSVAIALGATTAQAQDNGTGTGTGTGTEDVKPAAATEFWMGEEAAEGSFYLYNVGANIFVTGNTPSETDINKATLWTASGSDKSYSFTDEKGNLVITMDPYNAKIAKKGLLNLPNATKFGLETGTTKGKGNAYKLAYSQWPYRTRYFNVDNDKYTPAPTPGDMNDWFFISNAQKKAYTEYVDLFNKAKSYTAKGSKLFESKDVEKKNAIVKQINDALKSYNYNTYMKDGQAKLNDAIQAAEAFINATTGINEIGSTTDAKVSEIYGVNGARKSQLTKGLNIVKMSDGTVKKVLVK